MKGRRRGVAAVALVVAALGCDAHRAGERRSWRFLAAAPLHSLPSIGAREIVCDERIELVAGLPSRGVELIAGSRVAGLGDGLVVRGGEVPPRLRIGRERVPAEVRAVAVEVAGLRRGDLRVVARNAAGDATVATAGHNSGSGPLKDRFVVELEPAREPIVSIELEPTTVAGEIVTVREICLGRLRADGARLDVLAGTPWKATLADTTRDVLIVPSSGRIARRGPVASDAKLRFGLGQLGGAMTDVRLRVSARSGGEPERELFSRQVPAATLAEGWQDFVVPLLPAVGPDVELALEATPASGATDFVAAFSAPRVDAPERGDERPNIVLISVDTLRADHLSLYGYARRTSPAIDAWASRHAVVFESAIAPSGWTLPSHFSLFTGLDAYRHPANYNSVSLDVGAYSFLAELLWRSGYRTEAITGGVFVHPDYALATGFESFAAWRWRDRLADELDATVRRAQAFLDSDPPGPYFLFLHTYEPHAPNPPREPYYSSWAGSPGEGVIDYAPDPPSPDRAFLSSHHAVLRSAADGTTRRLEPNERHRVVDAYDSAVAYLDARLAALLERLSRPAPRRTVVALVSDHGEALGEKGRFGHAYLSMDNLHVPLVVSVAEAGGRRVAEQVRLIDLFPTLLELARLPVPADVDAKSLAPFLRGERAPARTAYAYAASTNYGLAAIDAEGLKVDWRNTPWRPEAGRVERYTIRGAVETDLPVGAVPERAERLLAGLAARYAAASVGARLALTNRSDGPVRVELTSELVDPVSLKTVSLGGAVASTWRDVGVLELELAPGATAELQFERAPRATVAIRMVASSARCSEEARTLFDEPIARLRTGSSRLLRLTGCGPAKGEAVVEVALSWRGPVGLRRYEADAALERSLRALGYLP